MQRELHSTLLIILIRLKSFTSLCEGLFDRIVSRETEFYESMLTSSLSVCVVTFALGSELPANQYSLNNKPSGHRQGSNRTATTRDRVVRARPGSTQPNQ